jgi:hypothetical protein
MLAKGMMVLAAPITATSKGACGFASLSKMIFICVYGETIASRRVPTKTHVAGICARGKDQRYSHNSREHYANKHERILSIEAKRRDISDSI